MCSWWKGPRSGQCCDCQPNVCDDCGYTVSCQSRSASKTKCGYPEYGTPSSPPKIYLVRTLSGSITDTFVCPSPCEIQDVYTWSGACTTNRANCVVTDTTNQLTQHYEPCGTLVSSVNTQPGCGIPLACQVSITKTLTVKTVTGTGCGTDCYGTYNDISGVAYETLSSEYTTALLSSDVDTALAAASWSGWGSCPDAIFTQSSNEVTISKRQVWYEWTFGACASPGSLQFDIYDRTSSTLQAHITISLTAGQTVADYILNPPATAGMALYITNVVISC